ncbi:MAG: hypothetical protein ACI35R_03810 [Bacillus sp. (in: firmicutes)]
MKSKQECLMDLINMSMEQDALIFMHFTQYSNGPIYHDTAKANADRVHEVLGGEMEHIEHEIANSYRIESGGMRVIFSYVPEEEESSTYLEEDVKFDDSEIC